ncbi:MAG TPA: prepilin-type N-terminal cleavage/methylation domain-containing protein [Gaiellaceae bacterium]|jgi:prepilin-type N-terminal cleavage/methylation domain-containing protein
MRSREDGFTLVELLVVVVIVAALITIAVPSYLGFTGHSRTKAAEQRIRAAMPAAEAFYADNGTYVGLGNAVNKNPPGIASYDRSLGATVGTGSSGKPTATTYCLNAVVQGTTVSARGPGPSRWYRKANCSGTSTTAAP